MTIRVLLADDHAVLRDGLRSLLEQEPDIRVVGDASDGRVAVESAARLQPHVVVMDIAMPGLNGVEATQHICKAQPQTKVLILSMHASSEHIYRALQAGALGYLLKESAGTEVVAAVRAVSAGRRYLSEKISHMVVDAYVREPHVASPLESLSSREREILQLIVEGHSNAQASKILSLSVKTVETYRSRVMHKLGIEDLPSLVKFAIEHGITPLK